MLQKIGFQPGINKQVTPTTAEGQWIDCDNVRFRYGTPEKIGGWNQLGTLNENELTKTKPKCLFSSFLNTNKTLILSKHEVFKVCIDTFAKNLDQQINFMR